MGRVPGLSLRTWVGYGFHKRTIRGHGPGSGINPTCDVGHCFVPTSNADLLTAMSSGN